MKTALIKDIEESVVNSSKLNEILESRKISKA
jgi:hypothetical protein